MSLDPRVRELIDREVIREVLQRYCRGVERRDRKDRSDRD